MRRVMCRIIFSLVCLLMSGYLIFAPLTTVYADEKIIVPENIISTSQVAMSFGNSKDPVEVVTGASEILGFNPKIDTFTLIRQDEFKAIVQVTHNGGNFDVTLEAAPGGTWTIMTMNTQI